MARIRFTCVFTVAGDTTSAAAIRRSTPARDPAQHLELALGESAQRSGHAVVRRRPAHVLLDQPPGQAGGEQGLPGRDGADPLDEPVGRRRLEQEPGRAGVERVVDQPVDVVRGQHQHPARQVLGDDRPGGGDAVHHRHPDVHQHDVGSELAGEPHGLAALGGGADHGAAARLDDELETGAHQVLVVDDGQWTSYNALEDVVGLWMYLAGAETRRSASEMQWREHGEAVPTS